LVTVGKLVTPILPVKMLKNDAEILCDDRVIVRR
jgi:hypothetical protein